MILIILNDPYQCLHFKSQLCGVSENNCKEVHNDKSWSLTYKGLLVHCDSVILRQCRRLCPPQSI